jgi:hypothetical protein
MTDVMMLEAAFFQLRTAAQEADATFAPQLGLCVSVLGNAIASARDGVNAARVNDIEFAVNDLGGAVDELGQTDADRIAPLLAAVRQNVEALKASTALDPVLLDQIRAFQSSLRERMKAIERQTYVEGGRSAALPHSPEELRDAAVPMARQLVAAGFATPSLDSLIADPASLRFHTIRDILDELDVIAG